MAVKTFLGPFIRTGIAAKQAADPSSRQEAKAISSTERAHRNVRLFLFPRYKGFGQALRGLLPFFTYHYFTRQRSINDCGTP
jgi:hypothetical protein